MQKIYIVTSGKYSDYGIDAVFESREKAEAYCRCHKGCDIGVWEFSDDKIYTTFDVVYISGNINTESPWVDIKTYSREDDPDKEKNEVLVSFWGKDDTVIDIFKILPATYDKETEEEKSKRLFWDCAALVKNEIKDCHDKDWYLRNSRWGSKQKWEVICDESDYAQERFEIQQNLEALLNETVFSSENATPETLENKGF